MKFPLYAITFFSLIFLFFACQNKDSTTKEVPTDSTAIEPDPWANVNLEDESDPFRGLPLSQKVDALLDSIDIQWYAWNKRDDERNANILALTKEIAKLPKHNKILLDSVRLMHKIALEKKLTQENMLTPNRIDEYDNNMMSMIEKLARLLEMTPKIDICTICQDYFRQIKETDELEFLLRKDYDDNAFMLNDLLDKEKTNLDTLGNKYQTVKKFPVFAIM